MIIEPVTDITISDDDEEQEEKREITKLSHVIYKVKRQEEDVTAFDYGKHKNIFDYCMPMCSLTAKTFVLWSCGTWSSTLPHVDNKVPQLHTEEV